MSILYQQKTAILDTNLWVAFFLQEDVFHYESKRIIGRIIKQKYKILMLAPVLYESINILAKNHFNKADIIKFTNEFSIVEFSYIDLSTIIMQYLGKVKLKSQDFIIFLYCARIKPDLFITLDKNLKLAAKQQLNL